MPGNSGGGGSILSNLAAQKLRNLKAGRLLGVTPAPAQPVPTREQENPAVRPAAPLQASSTQPKPDERMFAALEAFYKNLGFPMTTGK